MMVARDPGHRRCLNLPRPTKTRTTQTRLRVRKASTPHKPPLFKLSCLVLSLIWPIAQLSSFNVRTTSTRCCTSTRTSQRIQSGFSICISHFQLWQNIPLPFSRCMRNVARQSCHYGPHTPLRGTQESPRRTMPKRTVNLAFLPLTKTHGIAGHALKGLTWYG